MLVLDDADGVIESEGGRASFLQTLSAMRILSDNNMTFVVSSRMRLQDLLLLE